MKLERRRISVKTKNIILLVVTIVLLAMQSIAYCDGGLSYAETVNLIKTTMVDNPSEYRKESYGTIKFDKCSLDYSVAGTYPVGDLYNIKYSTIDFSSLDPQESKTGNDYTPFIVLSFNNYFTSQDGYRELKLRTLVVNLSSEEKAEVLFKAFLHLGELCRGRGLTVAHNP